MAGQGMRGLYLITPDETDTARLVERVAAVLPAGPVLLQYRNKHAAPGVRREQAEAVQRLCRDHGVPLVINDDVELARTIDADGVHVGGEDGDPAAVRESIGPQRLLGVSCYADYDRAVASYVAFGAVRPSTTKPTAQRAGLELFARARSLDLPRVAIGGITLDVAPDVLTAGADLLAVISDVFDAPDPAAQARAYVALFAASRGSDPAAGPSAVHG